MKYTEKPEIVEAIQFYKDNAYDVLKWINSNSKVDAWVLEGKAVIVKTRNGNMVATSGDWVVKEASGEITTVGFSDFQKFYDPII